MEDERYKQIEQELSRLTRRLNGSRQYGNIDRSAYSLLHQIYVNGSIGIKALADEFLLDISTISRQAAALEQKQYVYRVPDPLDGRAYSLHLTELGEQELMTARQIRQERLKLMLKDWTQEELEQFGALLLKFNRSFLT